LRSLFGKIWQKPNRFARVLVAVLLLDLAAVVASIAAPTMHVQVDKGAIRFREGHAFMYPVQEGRWLPFFPYCAQSDANDEFVASNLILREDGALLGPAHTMHDQIIDAGMGAYSHWGRNIVFSSSDNTDPRVNTHVYTFSHHAVLDPRLILALLLTNAGILVWWAWKYLRAIPCYLASKRHRVGSFAVAAAPPAIVSVFLFAYLPPTWNGTDSSGFLVYDPLSFIPHYSPLYPMLMAAVVHVLGASDSAVLSIQLFQHILLISGIAYLASVERRSSSILVLSTAASIGVALDLYAHGIFTEGLALPLLIFQIGAFVRIARFGWGWNPAMAVYHISLLLAVLARQNSIPFGALLPMYGLARLVAERRNAGPTLRQVALGIGLVASVVVISQVLVVQYCDRLGQPSTSTIGRQGTYRMVETGALLSEPARQQFIERMQNASPDPAVRFAIERMIRNPLPWRATRDEIKVSPLLRGRDPDEVMNSAFFIFLRAYEPASLTQVMVELEGYIFPAGGKGMWMRGTGQFSYVLPYSLDSVTTILPDDLAWPRIESIAYFKSPFIYRYQELLDNPIVQLLDAMAPGILLGLLCILAVAASLMGRCRPYAIQAAVALTTAGLLYAISSALVTVTIVRYLAPLYLVLWLGIGLVVAEMVGSRVRQTKPAAEASNMA
jgi:hypothetical protein